MNILQSIKKMFKTKEHMEVKTKEQVAEELGYVRTGEPTKSDPKIPESKWNDIGVHIIDIAPNMYLVHRASRICVGKGPLPDAVERVKHVSKITKLGHESVLEHSNVVAVITIPNNTLALLGVGFVYELVSVLSTSQYLHVVTGGPDDSINILIGGSIRGFMNVIRENDENNGALPFIKKIIYQSIEKEFLSSLIDNDLLDDEQCTYYPDAKLTITDEEAVPISIIEPVEEQGKRVDTIYIEDVEKVADTISKFGFDREDAYKVCTVSLLFHNVSRSCANQMTRHRVAISQESQRYCKHSTNINTDFINPVYLNTEERYKDLSQEVKDHIKSFNPFASYNYLISNSIAKEDARAWLPMNVTTKLMMTFTYKQLAHFCKVRGEAGAQKEIRLISKELSSVILNNTPFGTVNEFYDYCLTWDAINFRNSSEDIDVDDGIGEVVEDIKPLNINSVDEAEEYMKKNEEYKNLSEND